MCHPRVEAPRTGPGPLPGGVGVPGRTPHRQTTGATRAASGGTQAHESDDHAYDPSAAAQSRQTGNTGTSCRPRTSAGTVPAIATDQPAATPTGRHLLWFRRPAVDWQSQALPIGNGRLGAMLFGQPDHERIQFNEQSLWAGVDDYDNAVAGQPDDVFDPSMTGFGCYLAFGDLHLRFHPHQQPDVGRPGGGHRRAGHHRRPPPAGTVGDPADAAAGRAYRLPARRRRAVAGRGPGAGGARGARRGGRTALRLAAGGTSCAEQDGGRPGTGELGCQRRPGRGVADRRAAGPVAVRVDGQDVLVEPAPG